MFMFFWGIAISPCDPTIKTLHIKNTFLYSVGCVRRLEYYFEMRPWSIAAIQFNSVWTFWRFKICSCILSYCYQLCDLVVFNIPRYMFQCQHILEIRHLFVAVAFSKRGSGSASNYQKKNFYAQNLWDDVASNSNVQGLMQGNIWWYQIIDMGHTVNTSPAGPRHEVSSLC